MIVSIDIETTGLDPETCQILEIGAATFEGEEFHCFVDNGESYALQLNQKILQSIASCKNPSPLDFIRSKSDVLHVGDVVPFLKAWLPKEFTVAGKNFAAFDLQFLKKLPGWNIKVGHRFIDPGMLYWKPDIDGDQLPNLQTCMKRAGIQGTVSHTALEDANMVLKLIKRWKQQK